MSSLGPPEASARIVAPCERSAKKSRALSGQFNRRRSGSHAAFPAAGQAPGAATKQGGAPRPRGKSIMSRAMKNAAAAVCIALIPAGLAAAHARGEPRSRPPCLRRSPACAPAVSPGAIEAPQAARVVPDWTVQYGQVTNPHGSSGSFGAMLEGRNPAAGAIP